MLARFRNQKAFSLVELLVVITIIAILSVVAYTAVGGQTAKARDARRKQDLAALQSALELYFQTNNIYPADLNTTPDQNLMDPPGTQPAYMDRIPDDPYNFTAPTTAFAPVPQPYSYVVDPTKSTYLLGATLENNPDSSSASDDTPYIVGNGARSNPGALVMPGRTLVLSSLVVARSQSTTSGTYACATNPNPANCVPYLVNNR